MIQLLLNNSVALIGVVFASVFLIEFSKRFIGKHGPTVEAEDVHAAYFLIERKRRGHSANIRQSQSQAKTS